MDIAADTFYKTRFSSACPVIAFSIAVHALLITWIDVKPDLSRFNEINLGGVVAPASVAVTFAAVKKIRPLKPKIVDKKELSAEKKEQIESRKILKNILKSTDSTTSRISSASEHKKELLTPDRKLKKNKKESYEKKLKSDKVVETAQKQILPTALASSTQKVSTPGISDSEEIITEPVFRNEPPSLSYPRTSIKRNQQGKVMVEVIINLSGDPVDVKVLKSSGYRLLDQAALAWVERLEFMPFVSLGHAETAKIHIPVLFKLDGGRRG